MHPSVRAAFPSFTNKFEGYCTWMYLDVKGLVTTGRGNLVDPVTSALVLPWKQAYTAGNFGALATRDQIVSEWMKVKSLKSMAKQGGGSFARVTSLRLAPEDVDALTFAVLDRMWGQLLARSCFANAENVPADAQLGLLSMCWAMGGGGFDKFPKFSQAFANEQWEICQAECKMDETGNPGLVPRNAANRVLFGNAAYSGDFDQLYYPEDLESQVSGSGAA